MSPGWPSRVIRLSNTTYNGGVNKHYVKVAGSNNVAARDVYHHQLQGQVAARAETESRDREREAAQQSVHFQVGPSECSEYNVAVFRHLYTAPTLLSLSVSSLGTRSGAGPGTERLVTARRGKT